jgi:putative tricarboxylic transport membrane protein
MTKRSANVLLGTILAIAGIFIAVSATKAAGSRQNELGPALFPVVSALFLAVLGTFTAIHALVKEEKVTIRFISKRFLLGLLIVIGYAVLLKFLGYIISGILFMASVMFLMLTDPVKKAWFPMVITGILAPVIVYIIFRKFLLVPLPEFSLW